VRSTARRDPRAWAELPARDQVEHLHGNAVVVHRGAAIFARDLATPIGVL
jgi:hypothetical protein